MELYIPTEKLTIVGNLYDKLYEAIDSREISELIEAAGSFIPVDSISREVSTICKEVFQKLKFSQREIDFISECSNNELFMFKPKGLGGPQVAETLQDGLIVGTSLTNIYSNSPNVAFIPYIPSELKGDYITELDEIGISTRIIADLNSGRYGEDLMGIKDLIYPPNISSKGSVGPGKVYDFTSWYILGKIPTECNRIIKAYIDAISENVSVDLTFSIIEELNSVGKVKEICAKICRDFSFYSSLTLETNAVMLMVLDGSSEKVTLPISMVENIYDLPVPGNSIKDLIKCLIISI